MSAPTRLSVRVSAFWHTSAEKGRWPDCALSARARISLSTMGDSMVEAHRSQNTSRVSA